MSGKRLLWLAVGVLWLTAILLYSLPTHKVYADQITSRSLTLQASGATGGSTPGGTVNHLFTFTVPNIGSGNVGSIRFQYCTKAREAVCTSATTQGLDTTQASTALGTVTIGGVTTNAFTLNKTTNGVPYITRTAASIAAGAEVTVQLLNVKNPTPANYAFYVEITTYASTDTSGSPIDEGWVAASTANQIVLTGTMPESLIFCTGGDITVTGNIPDCTTATSGAITFNQLFSPEDTAWAVSKMAASTNAESGYNITVNGTTLTSGSNTVTPMNTTDTSKRGTSQFGLDLVLNDGTAYTDAPNVTGSGNLTPGSNGTNLRGKVLTGYDTAGSFTFNTGDSVANSASSGSGAPTDAQLYTVSYIVNVNGAQPAGDYTTTLSYICTATY